MNPVEPALAKKPKKVIRKKRKKSVQRHKSKTVANRSTDESENSSGGGKSSAEDTAQEQFFDARDSYAVMPASNKPLTISGLARSHTQSDPINHATESAPVKEPSNVVQKFVPPDTKSLE